MATLDNLFREQSSIEVKGRTLYVRALSDFDLQARDEFALREQAKLRRKLQDPNTDEYLTYLDWVDGADEELLRSTVLAYEESFLRRQALGEIQPNLIPMPDGADEEERDDILQKREEENKAVDERRAEWVKAQVETKKAEMAGKSVDELRALAKKNVTALQLWLLRARLFDAYTVFAAVYTDEKFKHKFVATALDAMELPSDIRTEIIAKFYEEMERVSSLDVKYFLSTDGSPDTSKP